MEVTLKALANKSQLPYCPAQAAVVELLKVCNEPQVWDKVEEVLKRIGTCPAVAVLDGSDEATEAARPRWEAEMDMED